ncbi:MAG: M13 family metallopeptidase, partial [Terriglobales bacterium]
AAHPIPADLPVTSVALPLFLYNQTILRNAMEKAAANKQATGTEKQVGDFWQSCMNVEVRNAKGKSWLQPYLNEVSGMKSKQDLAHVLAYLHLNLAEAWNGDDNSTKAPFFGFGPQQDYANASLMVPQFDQGGMALPSIDYYLDEADRFKEIRTKYVAHVQKMFEMIGEPAAQAAADAKTVMEIETAFAKASMDNVTRRDPAKVYNKRTLAELKTAVPDFDWNEYLRAMHAPAADFYIVTAPSFLTALEQQIKTRSLDDLRTYLRWWTVSLASNRMGEDFVQANFDFFGTVLSGTPQMLPQWRRCVGSADNYLGMGPLGEEYVKLAFGPEAKRRADEMVTRIRVALKDELEHNDWMSDATKKQAVIKEEATLQKMGYPSKWRDYSSVTIVSDNYLANVAAAGAFETHRQINRIGAPVDRGEWDMTPPTINAYENPQMNTLNFPAGIMQLPFFSPDQDDVANYGAIGMVIGHESVHGFDDEGRKFDAQGNLRDWWTPEDAKRYEAKDKCIVDEYSQEIPQLGVKQNGNLTAGEDTADNGGIHLSLLALESLYKDQGKSLDTPGADGITPRQRFFFSYAFSWCEEERPELAKQQVTTNPHSLPQFRVNRPLSNMPEFQKAFGCKPGQPMVSSVQCRVW